ncbi:MAG: 6-bladed beta-propeller [Balneolaceae bacterium]|nr:6-bladed beta-propeller [Balneolaceae bacterium]
MKTWLPVILLLLLVSCVSPDLELPSDIQSLKNLTVYDANQEPSRNISLHPEQTFSDTGQTLIGSLTDFEVDDQGRVYLADGEQLTVHVYNRDGEVVSRLGREGRGPGEFQSIEGLQMAAGRLFIDDNSLDRTTIYSTDSLVHVGTIDLAYSQGDVEELGRYSRAYLEDYLARSDGNLLLRFVSYDMSDKGKYDAYRETDHYYRLSENEELDGQEWLELPAETGALLPIGPRVMGFNVAFYGRHLRRLSSDDRLFTATPPHFLVKVYDAEGNYRRAFYHPYEGVPLTQANADKAGLEDYVLQGMSQLELPDTWPAINDMVIDDQNRLWVATIVEDFNMYEWWVLDEQGELLAQFRWPRHRTVEVVRDGKLYAMVEDTTTGVNEVVRWDIDLGDE